MRKTSYCPDMVVAHEKCGSTRLGIQDCRLDMQYAKTEEVLSLKEMTSGGFLRGDRDVLSRRPRAAGNTSKVKGCLVTVTQQSV